MKINTPKQLVKTNSKEIFEFLMIMDNYQELFPKDKIRNWESTDDTCQCEIKNMGKIGLKRVASTPNSLIYFDSYGKPPFKFTLNIFINELDANESEIHLEFDSEINPFMKLMVEKPLTDFFNGIIHKLVIKYN